MAASAGTPPEPRARLNARGLLALAKKPQVAVAAAMKDGKLGAVRRLVTHYGHQGPKEIGVGPEFFSWLTDPAKNGAGALYDFGCYGANFATWLFENQRPLSVFAVKWDISVVRR